MSNEQKDLLWQMYSEGISNISIANIMTTMINKRGILGEYTPASIKNITRRMQEVIDEVSGIKGIYDTCAERSITKLNR